MFQTAYRPLVALRKSPQPYTGGICRWWYALIQDILEFPVINPQTQMLVASPILKAGKSWYGPINVPDKQRGWVESQEVSRAGIFYKEKITGFASGNDAEAHINLQNTVYNEVVAVCKLRQGGMYILLGNDMCGLRLDHETMSGDGANDTPGTKLAFAGESINKALLLPYFEIDPSAGRHFITEPGVDFVMEDGSTRMTTE